MDEKNKLKRKKIGGVVHVKVQCIRCKGWTWTQYQGVLDRKYNRERYVCDGCRR
jgi:hypothetical protein